MCDPDPALETASDHGPATDPSVTSFNKDGMGTSGSGLTSELSNAEDFMMVGCQWFADVSDLGAVC